MTTTSGSSTPLGEFLDISFFYVYTLNKKESGGNLMSQIKKKTFFIFAVCLMLCVVVFAGCKKTEDPKNGGDQTPAVTYVKGKVSPTGFESEYLNLKFTAPRNFIMATEAELDALIKESADVVYADANKTLIDYALSNTVYEMMVSDSSGSPNLMVLVEKLVLSNMTESQYLDSIKTQVIEPFAAMGMQMNFNAIKTVDVAGETYTVLPAVVPNTLRQDYYVRKKEDRMVTIIVSYTDGTTRQAETLLAAFEPLVAAAEEDEEDADADEAATGTETDADADADKKDDDAKDAEDTKDADAADGDDKDAEGEEGEEEDDKDAQ